MLSFVALVLIGRPTASGARPSASPPPAPAEREAPAAATPSAHEVEAFVGVFLAAEAANVTASTIGRIASMHVRLGDEVEFNSVIARLDARTSRLDVGVARAALATQAVELRKARADAKAADERQTRMDSLARQGLASGEEAIAARTEGAAALLRADAAEAVLAEKRAQLARLEHLRQENAIRAPIGGTIVARSVDPGSTVVASTPIVRIARTSETIVRFAIPAGRREMVVVGSKVRALSTSTGTAVFAIVARIASELDPAAHAQIAEAVVQPDATTHAGMLIGDAVRVFPVDATP